MNNTNINYIDEYSYKPSSCIEGMVIRYCRQRCKQNNCSFFSREDSDGNIWHFGGSYTNDYYYAFFNNKLVRKKVENFLQDSFEDVSDYSFIK